MFCREILSFEKSPAMLDQRAGLFDHARKVAFLHDQKILAFDLYFGAGPFAEQNRSPGFTSSAAQIKAQIEETTSEHAVVQWTEMHEHPPLQFSDVISPAPKQPPGENALGAAKIRFKRQVKIFRTRIRGYPDGEGRTDDVAHPRNMANNE